MENKELEDMANGQEQAEAVLLSEEKEKKGMAIPALQYGLLTAIGLIAITLIGYLAKLSTASWLAYVGYAVLLAGIVLGIKNFRDEHRAGFISYGTALGFGTLSMFFAALFAAIFTYLFYTVIAPDAMIPLREAAELQMLERNPNMTDQEYDMAMRFISPGMMSIGVVFSYTFIGFVLSLIVAAVLKKKDPMEM